MTTDLGVFKLGKPTNDEGTILGFIGFKVFDLICRYLRLSLSCDLALLTTPVRI